MTSLDATEQQLVINFVFASMKTPMQSISILEEIENMLNRMIDGPGERGLSVIIWSYAMVSLQ
jgi:hypothetical protein